MSPVVPVITLNDGRTIPNIGLGTFKTKHMTEEIVEQAIDCGYRLIDTAPVYHNEIMIGRAIRKKIREGVIKRQDIFVITKLWNTHHSKGEVLLECEKSLRNLSIDYIDLYLMNWPFGLKSRTRDNFKKQEFYSFDATPIEETWKEMELCVKKGLVKSVGVSNFNSNQLQRLLDSATIKPAVNQIECTLRLNQSALISYCKERGVVLIGHRPLGAPGRAIELTAEEQFQVAHDSNYNMAEIAKKHKKSPIQLCLRYIVELGVIPIPKTAGPIKRLQENINIFDFSLDEEDKKYIKTLENNYRITLYDSAKTHPEYPFGK